MTPPSPSPSPSPSPPPPFLNLHHGLHYPIAIAAASSSLLLLLLTLLLLLIKKHQKSKRRTPLVDDPEDPATSPVAILHHATSHPLISVDAATDSFHPSLVLGHGCLGTVYKATSTSSDVFAVKRIHSHLILNNNAGLDFISKIKSLSFVNHPNVVSIIGYSQAPGERIIISEFVDGRSLDYFLDGYEILDWRAKVKIAAGIARGLESLHEGGIVHGRIKPSNILISSNFDVKVCDYGLSFLGRHGLVGYSDGEGKEEGSEANDVYGLGVVLLEILSGRRSEGGLIADWALPLIKMGRIEDFLDRTTEPGEDLGVSVRMAKVASACVGNGRRSRPAIGQVAAILSSLEMI